MKVKVLLDIDGVIADFYTGFGDHLNKSVDAGLDLSIGPPEYSLHKWGHNLPKDLVDSEIPKWILGGGYRSMPIFSGAKEFVYKLMDKYNVYIVTARVGDFRLDITEKVKEKIVYDTFEWFKKHGIPSNKLFFEHKKADFCKKNNIPIIIEDKLETVINGANEGIRCVLMDRSWNQDNNGLKRDHFNVFVAYSYNEILEILEKLTGEL
jgi:uncharacterized HAD superfamily protein